MASVKMERASFFILFLVLIVTIVLLTKGSAKLMGKILGKMVNERHHIAELIVNEDKVPGQWFEGFESKTSNVRSTLVYDEQRLELKKKPNEDC